MSTATLSKELLLYLDSTRDLYLTGFPELQSEAKLLFVGCEAGLEEVQRWSGERGQLLEAAIEKGMKLPRGQACVLDVGSISVKEAGQAVREKAACLKAQVVIVLGHEAAKKVLCCLGDLQELRLKVHDLGETPVVCTWELSAVLEQGTRKREFWHDIQKAMKYTC